MNGIEYFKEVFVDIMNYISDLWANIILEIVKFITENKIGVIIVAPIITGIGVLLIWHYIIKNENKAMRNSILIFIVEITIGTLLFRKIVELVNEYLIEDKITEFTYYMLGTIGFIIYVIIMLIVYFLIINKLGYDDEFKD